MHYEPTSDTPFADSAVANTGGVMGPIHQAWRRVRELPLAAAIILAPVFFLFALLWSALALVALPLYLPLRSADHSCQRQLLNQMRAARRVVPWDEVADAVQNGSGTVLEQFEAGRWWFWWTPDDVRSKCSSADAVAFHNWCVREYLDPRSGKALLIDAPAAVVRAGRKDRIVVL